MKKVLIGIVSAIVIIALILAAIVFVGTRSYVERSDAQRDESAMSEIVNAIMLGTASKDAGEAICGELATHIVDDNVATYETKTAAGVTVKYTMSGVTITFKPVKENGKPVYKIADGIINLYKDNKGMTLKDCEVLYDYLCTIVGDTIEISSKTYKNSDYTVFINIGDISDPHSWNFVGEFNGENLRAVDNSVQPNKKEDITPTDKNEDPTKPTEDDKNFGDILDDLLNPGKEKQNKQIDEANMTEIANAIMLSIVNDKNGGAEIREELMAYAIKNNSAEYGNKTMYGVTITFRPSDSSGRLYKLEDGIINMFAGGKAKLSDCQALYERVIDVVGEFVEMQSKHYRYSEYTVFVHMDEGGDIDYLYVKGEFLVAPTE